jgi:hypothetical protein
VRIFRLLGVAFATSGALGLPTAPDNPPPVAAGLHESVEVRLVTVDVVALDGTDRTVPDLTKEDFQLFVDRKETPVDTLDVACDGGSLDDPKANGRHRRTSRRVRAASCSPSTTSTSRRRLAPTLQCRSTGERKFSTAQRACTTRNPFRTIRRCSHRRRT